MPLKGGTHRCRFVQLQHIVLTQGLSCSQIAYKAQALSGLLECLVREAARGVHVYSGTLPWTPSWRRSTCARVLVRHGTVVAGLDGVPVEHSTNGIYYFAAGHGLVADGDDDEGGSLTLTRAPDMDTNVDVRGATTYVTGGLDAGKVFVVTEPEAYTEEFELEMNDIQWTAHTDDTVALAVQAVTEKRPCLASTGAALDVVAFTPTTLTLSGAMYLSEDGSWVVGGRTITVDDANSGARILVRHSVIHPDLSTYSNGNGIYYFAPGHGLAPESPAFVLTRAADMATSASVSSASVAILSGDDAGCRFLVTLPEHGEAFTLGTDDIEWSAARGNDAAATVLAGAGIAVAGGSTVSAHLDSLPAVDYDSLEGGSAVAMVVEGASVKCTVDQLAAFAQTLSNKTLADPAITGSVGFDEGAVLHVSGTPVLTLREGSLTVTGTLRAQAVAGPSDINLKYGVAKCPGLDVVRCLEGTQWRWKSDGSAGMGLIAQWLASVQPDLVVDGPDGLAILYNGVTGMLVNAVNDLDAALRAVVARVHALEERHVHAGTTS